MKNRNIKGQVKMGETIAILFIFFMFVVFGFIFYAKISSTSYLADLQEQNELLSIQSAQKIAYLPEIQCSSKNVLVDNCYDLLKIEAFSGLMKDDNVKSYYYDHFGYSEVRIRKVYPISTQEWILYNNTLEDTSSIFTPIPMSLYDPRTDKYYFGVVEIKYFPISMS